jgi:hypothetical protein|tara:strand:- start:990 stop:1571 length:582 start_codon:yes stop_codon:yes gene_type:complete
MKRLSVISLIIGLLFILSLIGCEKYQYVDKNTRFNKRTGETEILTSQGDWIEKSKQLKKESEKSTEKESEKSSENLFNIWDFNQSFPKSELRNVKISKMEIENTDIYSNSYSTLYVLIENNSKWRINEIDINVNIYSSSDSLFLITRKIWIKTDLTKDQGNPFTKTVYTSNIQRLEDNQYFTWSIIECRGFEN